MNYKHNFFLLLFILSFSIIISTNLQKIEAVYDPSTDSIIFNNKNYSLSQKTLTTKLLENHEEKKSLSRSAFLFNLILFILLSCFAGTMSGLTVGYLSIDSLILELKINNGTRDERRYATKVLQVISNHHWLLVTLLLCNSFACEAMPIVLDKLVSEIVAIILSVTVLLFVGEIIPQALCTGPNQLKIATWLAPLTRFLMIITYPISMPIAKFMDYVIGEKHENRFKNSDLKTLIELHTKTMLNKMLDKDDEILNEDDYGLTDQQYKVISRAFEVHNSTIKDVMIKLDNVFSFDIETKIDKNFIDKIIDSGHSRLPIYEGEKNNLIGYFRTKKLIGLDLSKKHKLENFLSRAIEVNKDTTIISLYELCKNGKSHMAFVYEKNKNRRRYSDSITENLIKKEDKKFIGIVTLEDLIEYLLKDQIFDEEEYIKSKKVFNKALKNQITTSLQKSKKLDLLVNPKSSVINFDNSISYVDEKDRLLQV